MTSRDWTSLDVNAGTKAYIQEHSFKRMTPVQAIAIPLLMKRRDVAVEAATGSGKTLAYLIPSIELLLRCDEMPSGGQFHVGAIVLAPTRELAGQIHEVLSGLLAAVHRTPGAIGSSGPSRLGHRLLVGGAEAKASAQEIREIEAATQLQMLIGTTGRIKRIMELCKGAINWKAIEVVVLDEADRLLQLGFSQDLESILSKLPKQRRTGLFSATLTSELQQLMKSGMRNPVHVCVKLKRPDPAAPAVEDAAGEKAKALKDGSAESKDENRLAVAEDTPKTIVPRHEVPLKLKNFYVELAAQQRLAYLVQFLRSAEVRKSKTVVFFLTCACVDYFATLLRLLVDGKPPGPQSKKTKFRMAKKSTGPGRIEKLHGKMEQVARQKAYQKFRDSPAEEGGVLLATDLAARGIDVDCVDWVVQFDAPQDPSAFVHRIGRTARAGKSGQALVMLLPHEDCYIQFLEKRGLQLQERRSPTSGLPPFPAPDAPEAMQPGPTDECVAVARRAKKLVETDRVTMKQSTNAFMSFVRAYKEHELQYLFPFKRLDLGSVATGYCLLRLPRIKEILGKKVENFQQSWVVPKTVPLRNKNQETLRLQMLEDKEEEKKGDGTLAIHDKQKAKKELAIVRRMEDAGCTDIVAMAVKPKKVRTKGQKRRATRRGKTDEWDLLQEEERMAKKLRKGKITAEEFAKKEKRLGQRYGKVRDEFFEKGKGYAHDSDDDLALEDAKDPGGSDGEKDASDDGKAVPGRVFAGRKRRVKRGRK